MSTENRAFIGVGSNIAPRRNLPAALRALQTEVRVVACSTFYASDPEGRPEQPRFINGVWQVATALPARDLKFSVLRSIESALGRRRTADTHAPRTIDLDLILYADMVCDEPDLVLPDPDIERRSFLAVPLCELAPELVLPGTGMRVCELPTSGESADLEVLTGFTAQLRDILAETPPAGSR